MSTEFVEFNLPKGAYASFDAVTLKDYITDRLTENTVFTDQNFEGSNLAALTDIFAFTYHILLFYLNQTSSETMFDQTQLYENMNKLVKLIDYKPEGPKTSVVSFQAKGTAELPVGAYGIKRYSYINYNGFTYSFSKDVSFEKTITGNEPLTTFSDKTLLFQGVFTEYPEYTAMGESYEVLTLILQDVDNKNTQFIDYNNINIYVKNIGDNTWSQWEEIDSLYYAGGTSDVFEKRVNENGRVELKFGNNITGKKLNEGDIIYVFYLLSDGSEAYIDISGLLKASSIKQYNSQRFQELNSALYSDSTNINFVGSNTIAGRIASEEIELNNTAKSTPYSDYELLEDIKQNAPRVFSAQNRAVTIDDYESLLKKQFSNLFQSIKVVNNNSYIDNVIKYYYDIGLSRPNEDTNVSINQLKFADACDFNNIYVFALPSAGSIINEIAPVATPQSLKKAINDYIDRVKMVTNEIVICDPVYTAVDLGVEIQSNDPRSISEIRDNTTLVVNADRGINISLDDIKTSINKIILDYFDNSNITLGMVIDLADLSRRIIDISGVDEIYTSTTYEGNTIKKPGISLLTWNTLYPEDDINITTQNIQLPFFKVPFFYKGSELAAKIIIN